jgi:hypothetical protein
MLPNKNQFFEGKKAARQLDTRQVRNTVNNLTHKGIRLVSNQLSSVETIGWLTGQP